MKLIEQCNNCRHNWDGHCVKGNDFWKTNIANIEVRCEDYEKNIVSKESEESMSEKPVDLTVPEMCQDCTLYSRRRKSCPIQTEPGWLYEKFGTCWSKRTDPEIDEKIFLAMEKYKKRMAMNQNQ